MSCGGARTAPSARWGRRAESVGLPRKHLPRTPVNKPLIEHRTPSDRTPSDRTPSVIQRLKIRCGVDERQLLLPQVQLGVPHRTKSPSDPGSATMITPGNTQAPVSS
jgi:hypothetical protein